MSGIPVDRAGRPMFDEEGNKLSILEREQARENESFSALLVRVDLQFRHKEIKPSDYIVLMHEYDLWKRTGE